MSDKLISISIDVTMLDKNRFKLGTKPNKAGKIPQYVSLDVLLRRDGVDDYGNAYMVKQSNYDKNVPPKDRPQMPIIGNGKIIIAGSGGPPKPAESADAPTNEGDEVPF